MPVYICTLVNSRYCLQFSVNCHVLYYVCIIFTFILSHVADANYT